LVECSLVECRLVEGGLVEYSLVGFPKSYRCTKFIIYNFFFISSSGKQAAMAHQSVTITKQAAIGDRCDGCRRWFTFKCFKTVVGVVFKFKVFRNVVEVGLCFDFP